MTVSAQTTASQVDTSLDTVDALFWTIVPEDAINFGYMLHVQTTMNPNDPRTSQVKRVIEGREKTFSLFESIPRTLCYITAIREAAIAYSRGLDRADRIFAERKKVASEKKSDRRRNKVMIATKNGLLRGGVRLAIFAVTIFSAVLTILHLDIIHLERFTDGRNSPSVTALAVAGLLTLFHIFLEIRRISQIDEELFAKYVMDIERAEVNREIDREMVLRTAYGMIQRDYRVMLGREPPDEEAALTQLLAPVLQSRHEHERELHQLESALAIGILQRLKQLLGTSFEPDLEPEPADHEVCATKSKA